MPKDAKVTSIAYHRNGCSGRGFYVALVEAKMDDGKHRFLVSRFPKMEDEEDDSAISAIDVDMAARGDIEFGSNSWRGDTFLEVMDAAITKYDKDLRRRLLGASN